MVIDSKVIVLAWACCFAHPGDHIWGKKYYVSGLFLNEKKKFKHEEFERTAAPPSSAENNPIPECSHALWFASDSFDKLSHPTASRDSPRKNVVSYLTFLPAFPFTFLRKNYYLLSSFTRQCLVVALVTTVSRAFIINYSCQEFYKLS